MVIVGTRIGSSDNSGVRIINCIKVLGSHKYKIAAIGDKIVVSIKKSISKSRVKKNEVHNAVVVRTRRPFFRKLGTSISFQYNTAVVIDKKKMYLQQQDCMDLYYMKCVENDFWKFYL